MRRRGRRSAPSLSRRGLLMSLGAGLTGVGLTSTGAFTSAAAMRTTSIDVVGDTEAYVELLVSSEVKKNQREPLVDVTNNVGGPISVTVSLDDCTQGALYDPAGNSGCTVGFSLSAGASGTVDIEATVDGVTVPFTVEASSDAFTVQAPRSTDAVSGNATGAVEVTKAKDFSANLDTNDWTIRTVEAEFYDHFGDHVEYEVTDAAGNVVGTSTDPVGDTNTYQRKGNKKNPAITIDPVDGYTLTAGETYDLTVIAWDVEDNFDTASRSDTA